MVAFASDDDGNTDIWLIPAVGGEPLRLTDHPAADTDPAWFPDGSAVTFVSRRGGAPSIWRIPPLGGSPVELVADAADPTISPDGTRIAFSREGPDGLPRIAVAPLGDPAEARWVTGEGDGYWGHSSPAWSPDGHTLVYADFKNLWLVPAEGGGATPLTTEDALDQNPVWSPDGRTIFFSSVRDGTPALWGVRVSDGALHRLTSGTSAEAEPSLSANGSRIAYSTSDDKPDIVVVDRATGTRTEISGSTSDVDPAVAPDGSSVAFVSDRRGGYDLWLQPLREGSVDGPPRQITEHRGSVAVPAFSPDGRWLAYHRVDQGQRDIWIVPTDGGVPQRFTEHPAIDINPTFSPDGTRLAFISRRGGVENLWVAPVAGGRRTGESRQLTRSESVHWFPVWSPDGERIAYVVLGGGRSEAWVVEVDSGAPPVQLTDGADARHVHWSADGGALFVAGTWGADRIGLRVVALDVRHRCRGADPGARGDRAARRRVAGRGGPRAAPPLVMALM
jgi:Tol biopolymer transport system component